VARPFQNVVYLRVRRRWLGVQVLTFAGRVSEWVGPADVVFAQDLKGKPKVYLPDDPALFSAMSHRPFTAFGHPRVLMDDFNATSEAVAEFLRRAGYRKFPMGTVFIVQIQEEWEGGLSDIERRAMVEMCRHSGATNVLLVTGSRDLAPPDLLLIARRRVETTGDVLALDA
jgi:hypothetical protein